MFTSIYTYQISHRIALQSFTPSPSLPSLPPSLPLPLPPSLSSVKREQQGPLSSPQQQQQQSSSSSAGVCEWGDEVILLVDRQTFPVNPRLFTRHPDTMLGR